MDSASLLKKKRNSASSSRNKTSSKPMELRRCGAHRGMFDRTRGVLAATSYWGEFLRLTTSTLYCINWPIEIWTGDSEWPGFTKGLLQKPGHHFYNSSFIYVKRCPLSLEEPSKKRSMFVCGLNLTTKMRKMLLNDRRARLRRHIFVIWKWCRGFWSRPHDVSFILTYYFFKESGLLRQVIRKRVPISKRRKQKPQDKLF